MVFVGRRRCQDESGGVSRRVVEPLRAALRSCHSAARRNPPCGASPWWVSARYAAVTPADRAQRLNPPYGVSLHWNGAETLEWFLSVAGDAKRKAAEYGVGWVEPLRAALRSCHSAARRNPPCGASPWRVSARYAAVTPADRAQRLNPPYGVSRHWNGAEILEWFLSVAG